MEDLLFEIKRKLVHISTIIYILIYYIFEKLFSQRAALLVLVFILIFLSFLEFLKIRYNVKIPLFNKFYRETEKNKFSGSIYLVLGMIISFAVFDFNIALAAVLMMILGDSASAIVGRLGKHKINYLKASWEGIISEFLVDAAIGIIFLSNFIVILVMALCATIIEILIDPIDDNLAVPVVAGFAGQALTVILRILNV